MTLEHFLNMGGYAEYVWPCYIIVFTVLIGLLLHHYRQFKLLFKNNRDLANNAVSESYANKT